MKPTREFQDAVSRRVEELSGKPWAFELADTFPGTDPNVPEAARIEAMAQSIYRVFILEDFEEIDPSTAD